MAYWLDQFHVFLLILLRVSAVLAAAPIFGHRSFLARAKLGLSMMVTLIVFPLVIDQGFEPPVGIWPYVFMMVREVIMGLILGFAVLLVFVSIQFAGQLAGLQMGFGIVNVIDPQSSDQISIIGQFLNILAILMVLTLNGHHMILNGLVHSFQIVPLGGVEFNAPVVEKLVGLTAEVFVVAVKISAPIMMALFLVSVAMGVLARTVPQMNVFIVGFPVQIAVGLSALMISLPMFYLLLDRLWSGLSRNFVRLLELL